ncbi:hypothetical protein MITS9509_00985 [Synechococcus sp. MIT S9509]|nr:hypothetical protein MITS9509_00985 [Synechococcus sp. MIT S9509]
MICQLTVHIQRKQIPWAWAGIPLEDWALQRIEILAYGCFSDVQRFLAFTTPIKQLQTLSQALRLLLQLQVQDLPWYSIPLAI